LLQVQSTLVPARVNDLLMIKKQYWLSPLLWVYKLCRAIKLDSLLKSLLLPNAYKAQIMAIDVK
jgi:hypothetical protein